ncbi:MAG: hypothetical protein OEZ39_13045 [Gammaproteobacteria bacterium]|nr:hypothetical protein [Gammaproteobacteria bacterium]MDH5652775.1 hypothetical protein [Gammaproteobacteria bacterium]
MTAAKVLLIFVGRMTAVAPGEIAQFYKTGENVRKKGAAGTEYCQQMATLADMEFRQAT